VDKSNSSPLWSLALMASLPKQQCGESPHACGGLSANGSTPGRITAPVGAVRDRLDGMALAGSPQRLEVAHGGAGCQLAHVGRHAEHGRAIGKHLRLQLRGCRSAVQCVTVRIDQHRRHVAENGCRMWGLVNLAHVSWAPALLIVLQAIAQLMEGLREALVVNVEGRMHVLWTELRHPGSTASTASVSHCRRSVMGEPPRSRMRTIPSSCFHGYDPSVT